MGLCGRSGPALVEITGALLLEAKSAAGVYRHIIYTNVDLSSP
jgi:hypothetical protein